MFKDIFTVEKGSHNDTWAAEMGKYLRKLKDFMDRANDTMPAYRSFKNAENNLTPHNIGNLSYTAYVNNKKQARSTDQQNEL